ncbi:MAG: DUF2783 domain-containing protein [Alphaproteobacteria bacterium]|nr:DUF2783 domain-containing protein [Alphaproteobacteria bacterium]
MTTSPQEDAAPSPTPSPDDLYAALIALHHERSVEESLRLNARLILLLADAVGDRARVLQAIRQAGEQPV